MSAINQMLRDLDKRRAPAHADTVPGVRPPVLVEPAPAPNQLASAYAGVRMMGPRTRLSRNLLLAGSVAALLPIAWAATHFERPAAADDRSARAVVAVTAVAMPPPAPVPASAPAPTQDRRATMATERAPVSAGPTVMAAVSVAAAGPAATVVVPAPAPPPSPPPIAPEVRNKPPALAAQAVTMLASPHAISRPVRAAVHLPLLGEDEAVRTPPRGGNATPSPKDTRLAMASPTVPNTPRDEARIERRPTDARDDLVRAGEAMSIGRTSDAIVLLRKVIQAEPENERARLALLSLLAERGRDDTWRSALTDSAKVLPRRFGLAAAQGLAESGRFEESLAILQGLPESVRDTRYFSALGATHQQLNQHAAAVTAFDAALSLAPASSSQLPSLLVAQALSMQTLGKVADARRNLERVRQMPDAAPDVRDYATRELAHSR